MFERCSAFPEAVHQCCTLLDGLACESDSATQYIVVTCSVVFRHYYKSTPKSAAKDFRDDAVVPFE